MSEGALAVIDADAAILSPVMSAEEFAERMREFQQFVKSQMVEGEDYGVIPGTKKPTLLKPGAEKLGELYGLAPHLEIVERVENWDKGFFHYEVRCDLVSKRTGTVVAQGVGSCNSMEARYRYRWVFEDDIPSGADMSGVPSKRLKTKYGWKTQYRLLNEDIYSQVNTILKMAKKRAHIDASLSATRSSGLFTQDLEDLRANGVIDTTAEPVDEEPPAPSPAPRQRTQTRTQASGQSGGQAGKRAPSQRQLDFLHSLLKKDGASKVAAETVIEQVSGSSRNCSQAIDMLVKGASAEDVMQWLGMDPDALGDAQEPDDEAPPPPEEDGEPIPF